MSNTLKIFCTNTGQYIPVEGGEDLAAILRRIKSDISFSPICARVNNKTEALHYQVYAPKQVEYLPIDSPSGSRVYIRSLCMMLYRAVSACYPGAKLSIRHSVSRGYYCRITGDITVTDEVVDTLKSYMRDLVSRDVAFERKERLTSDVIKIFEQQGLHDKV
ncbi:MAG: nucleoside kinase, partial [Muribaculaceae bacterium]|nr:nucleoside kinase [Muribaculaceae bacterium]